LETDEAQIAAAALRLQGGVALSAAEALRTFSAPRRGPIIGEISVIKTHLSRSFDTRGAEPLMLLT
jgi:hypothetical protein